MAGAAVGSSLFLKSVQGCGRIEPVPQKRGASWGVEDRVCIRDEVAGSSFSPAPAPTENRVVGELGPEAGWHGLRQDRACSSKACSPGRDPSLDVLSSPNA